MILKEGYATILSHDNTLQFAIDRQIVGQQTKTSPLISYPTSNGNPAELFHVVHDSENGAIYNILSHGNEYLGIVGDLWPINGKNMGGILIACGVSFAERAYFMLLDDNTLSITPGPVRQRAAAAWTDFVTITGVHNAGDTIDFNFNYSS
ncbi:MULTISPECIES: hypothetical protein [Paraburkholderia]|jgi:hypothetical protein|uniref:hypothetical protein n=1 Tax=Paraburkholderia TaxID=1822464 RepID=UPI00190DBDEC|nr:MULTISPECIES: hypothetical protein [Paraburkholderia]MCP2087183.1 hypothetical protein [Paraburkholderia sediminicola]MBK3843810.1 hypothetical protein [Paraburkholderia aspalathi]MCX4156136.1 hypothetical protein [Paraburkholderia aspalathi]MDN7165542.1 hypothetical protein [Paraburkholderia sp. SECH2]MDQ6394028.1 hypothetical protein [Paraburkholderia aspalathi]